MDNEIMSKYVEFIFTNLKKELDVVLKVPKKNGELVVSKFSTVLCKVTIEILELYTRSGKLKISFDKYSDESIYYLSRKKGPEILFKEINDKISKIVNNKFIEDGREDEIRLIYENKLKTLSDKLQILTKNIKK